MTASPFHSLGPVRVVFCKQLGEIIFSELEAGEVLFFPASEQAIRVLVRPYVDVDQIAQF